MKKLLPYLANYKKECILAPLFKMLEALFDLFVPLVVAAIIDVGIAQSDQPYILKMCLLLAVLALVGLLFSFTAQWFAARAAVGFATQLRHALFAHIQGLSFTEQDTLGASTLTTRLTSDINFMQNGLNQFLRLFLRSPFIVFGAVIMAFTIDFKAALVFAVVLPLLCVVVFGVMLWTLPRYKKVQEALDRVLGVTRENLTGVRVIRAFNREQQELDRFTQANEVLQRLQVRVGRVSALTNPVTYVIINIGVVALIQTGAMQVQVGALTQGQVVALVNYMSQILVELIKLANVIILTTRSLACAGRVQSMLEVKNSMTVPEHPQPVGDGAVRFDHVSLAYRNGGEESLTDISFAVQPGQTVGVIGGTGSGKSSLVNLIPRFYDATAGSVQVGGVDVRQYDPEALRRTIGMVPQKAVLFRGSIRDNLRWGDPEATDEQLWQALTAAQAAEVVRGKPGGLDEEIEQGGRNLSGGQRQRLTIARALVRRPQILILDDSASALDFATDAALRRAIRELSPKPTTFIVSQRCSSIRQADLILVLDDGALVGAGTHDQLLESCPVYNEIYWSQFKKPSELAAEKKGVQ